MPNAFERPRLLYRILYRESDYNSVGDWQIFADRLPKSALKQKENLCKQQHIWCDIKVEVDTEKKS